MVDDLTYRVVVYPDRSAHVQWFGNGGVDALLRHYYDSVDDLPDWAQERLAILMMLPADKPTPEIPGVGRRISEDRFWVYAPV